MSKKTTPEEIQEAASHGIVPGCVVESPYDNGGEFTVGETRYWLSFADHGGIYDASSANSIRSAIGTWATVVSTPNPDK